MNKSKAIRVYKESYPLASNKEISAALQKQGIDATPGFVATILHSMRKKTAKTRDSAKDKFLLQARAERARLQAIIEEHESAVERLEEVDRLIAKLEKADTPSFDRRLEIETDAA